MESWLYGIMNYVVIPLSAVPQSGSKNPLWVGLSIVVHMFLIGVPIAVFSRRAIERVDIAVARSTFE